LGPFGEALAKADEGISHILEHGKSVSNVMLGAGGSLVAVGGLFSSLGSKEQAAHQQLSQAITNSGHAYKDYGDQIDAAVKHNEKFGESSVETQGALQTLTQATGNPTKALALLSTATDLAAAKHEDLVTAATAVGKVYNGNTKLLKEFGIQATSTASLTKQSTAASNQAQAADSNLARAKRSLADIEAIDGTRHKLTLGQQIQLRNAQEAVTTATGRARDAHTKLTAAQLAVTKATSGHGSAVAQLSDKLKGQASASADTFNGHLKAMSTKIEDQVSLFGEKYGPAITKTGAAIAGLGAIMKTGQSIMGIFSAGQKTAAAATDAMSASEDAAAVSEGLALWPILLIVAAIALLVAAAYLIWKNWKTIWADIQKAVQVVWDWIKNNWPLLLGILVGPIGLAAALIYKHWDQIKAAAKVVVDYIVKIWNDLVSFFTGIPARLYAILNGLWTFVSDEAATVSGWAKGVWNDLVNWVTGLPSALFRAMNGLWTFISDQARTVYGWVTGTWNTLLNWVAGLPRAVAGRVGNMWHGITDAFRAAINGLIDIWNALHFKIGGWHIGPVTVPTVSVGMPTIPHLAQGGLMTSSGLVFAHAGEVITPAPAAAAAAQPRGPAVNIEHAHFAKELDVEAFMKRVAWVAAARAV
jgi:hypothetical protein